MNKKGFNKKLANNYEFISSSSLEQIQSMCLPLNIIGKLSEAGWRLDQDTGQPGQLGAAEMPDSGSGRKTIIQIIESTG